MIRAATPADVPALLGLIHELAAFVRAPDAVEATDQSLHDALFALEPAVYALVSEAAGEVVGCAIWFVNFSTWTGRHGIYLEDLVVRANARRGGHGRELLAALAAICVERGYARLEWEVVDSNESARAFYASLGATTIDDCILHRLTGAQLPALAARAAAAAP